MLDPNKINQGQKYVVLTECVVSYTYHGHTNKFSLMENDTIVVEEVDRGQNRVYARHSGSEDLKMYCNGSGQLLMNLDVLEKCLGFSFVGLAPVDGDYHGAGWSPSTKAEPANNGSSETCHWCHKPTEPMFGSLRICRACDK